MGKKHRWFNREKVAEEPVVSEPKTHNVYKRKKRKEENVKTATVDEVEEVTRPPIFKEHVETAKERDYLETEVIVNDALYQDKDHDDEAEEDVLELSKTIADAFGLKNYREKGESAPLFDVDEPGEVEAETESLDEDSPESAEAEIAEAEGAETESVVTPWIDTRKGMDVLQRLSEDTTEYQSRSAECDNDFCELLYRDKKVPKAVTESGKLKLASYRVYVNGVEQDWDRLYEIKVPKGSRIDVETGVGVVLPKSATLVVEVADSTLAKFSLKQDSTSKKQYSSCEALDPIIASFIAEEGAYLSKIGRVVECQVVA